MNSVCGRSTSSVAGSPAKTSAQLVGELASEAHDQVSGLSSIGSLLSYDPGSRCWRTHQPSLIPGEDWTSFSESWPRSGMTRNGIAFPLPPSALITSEIGLWLLPTLVRPTARTAAGRKGQLQLKDARMLPTLLMSDGTKQATTYARGNPTLLGSLRLPTLTKQDGSGRGYQYQGSKDRLALTTSGAMRMLPTLLRRAGRSFLGAKRSARSLGGDPLTVRVGGALNPRWCELFMGFPIGWVAGLSRRSSTTKRRAAHSGTARKSRSLGTRSIPTSQSSSR